jgi:hypothetical protein
MSHTVEIVSQFYNVDLLKKAFESFGWIFKSSGKIRTYTYDELRDVEYDHVAFNPNGKFDLGIKHIGDQYKIFGDFYDPSIAQQLGAELGLLKQQYSKNIVDEHLEEEDEEYDTNVLEDGSIELEVYAQG